MVVKQFMQCAGIGEHKVTGADLVKLRDMIRHDLSLNAISYDDPEYVWLLETKAT